MTVSAKEQLKALNQLYKEGDELYHNTAKGLGVSDSAMMILYGLGTIGRPCTQKELCDTWYLKKQTLHSALKNLMDSGDVKMEPHPENPRLKLIFLTKKGWALCRKTAYPLLEAERKAFERLTPAERDTLLELTRKHTEFMQEESARLLEQHRQGQKK